MPGSAESEGTAVPAPAHRKLYNLNNNGRGFRSWVDVFGGSRPKIVQLDLSENQFQIYNKISRNYTHSFLFESLTGPERLAETSVMGFDPRIIVRGYPDRVEVSRKGGTGTETVRTDDPLAELKRLLGTNGDRSYRYLGGAVGVVNYDAVRLVEDIPDRHGAPGPLMEFGVYDDGILYDNVRKKLFYFHYGEDRSGRLDISDGGFGEFESSGVTPDMDEAQFSDIVNRAKGYIHDGEVFQVVLSRRFGFRTSGDTLALYGTLRRLNPSPYMYHLKHGRRTVIGASPEMLVRVTGDTVETFPIAGTRRATGDAAQDRRLAEELLHDEKELAEHTMLVDLGRNDIGRVCRYGTVRPEELMRIRAFSHVQHMVTHVVGRLDPEKDMFDAFRAVFPAGTVSGAPKVRAMEVIDELERGARGAYAGAVGYFSFNGCCDFAIAIRSIFIDGDRGYVQSGAGIVSDSVPANEFRETEHKAGAMIQAIREASSPPRP